MFKWWPWISRKRHEEELEIIGRKQEAFIQEVINWANEETRRAARKYREQIADKSVEMLYIEHLEQVLKEKCMEDRR